MMTDRPPRWTEYMPLDELQPALRNPKDHDEDLIDASITRFGVIESVVLDERTGRLVGGHGRRTDALRRREAGETPPDGIVLGEEDAWLVPVQRGWRSSSDEEAHAASIALNQATIAGGFDDAALAELLSELATSDGLLGTGFDEASLDDLLASLGDELLLNPDGTDAAFADGTQRGEAGPPRSVQGLHEVGLIFQADAHREYLELMARLRNAWGEDVPALIVLRALRESVEHL